MKAQLAAMTMEDGFPAQGEHDNAIKILGRMMYDTASRGFSDVVNAKKMVKILLDRSAKVAEHPDLHSLRKREIANSMRYLAYQKYL